MMRAIACRLTRVGRTHVARHKQALSQRLRRGRHPRIGCTADAVHVCDDLLVALLARRMHEPAHAVHNHGRGARVHATREGQQEALCARATHVVPQPACRTERDFLLGRVVAYFDGHREPRVRPIFQLVRQWRGDGDAHGLCVPCPLARGDGLHTAALGRAVRTHIGEVDGRRDDIDVLEAELVALRDDLAVERDQGAAVVVHAIAIAAALIRVEVHTAELEGRLPDQFDAAMQFSELVVTST